MKHPSPTPPARPAGPTLRKRCARGAAAAWAAFGLAGLPVAQAEPAWITLGAEAYEVLRTLPATVHELGRNVVRTQVPESPRSVRLVPHEETVVAVQIDDDWIEMLSMLLHRERQRCGGFVQHASEAEARAVLHRLSQAGPEPRVVGPAPSYAVDNGREVGQLMPRLQASHLMATVDGLTAFQNRRHTSSHGVAAAHWLADHWRSLIPASRRDVRVVPVVHAGWPQNSVMLEIVGNVRPSETVVLGGHLDSIAPGTIEGARAPGADDNASGIAALTEVIRVMMEGGYKPGRTLRFIGYAAEEVGLRGSGEIAADFLARSDAVVGVLQLDMTAFQGDSTDIWLYTDYTNAQQNAFLANLVTKYVPQYSVGYSACGYGCSDHAAWHARGFRASFPHEASNANYNRAIHTIHDTTATFGNSPAHMLKFTQLALAYAVELGTLPRGSR